MITKTVKQYTCEHCGKKRLSRGAMTKHEKHCTMNPLRHCGMCAMFDDNPQSSLQPALMALPVPDDFMDKKYGGYDSDRFTKAVNKTLPSIRNYFNDCPACIMAALRQKGIPVPIATDFNFTEECKSAWGDFNDAHYRPEHDYRY